MPTVEHPGIRLREMIEEKEWIQADLAFILKCPPKSVNQIVNGKQGISPAMSKMLGQAFGVSENYFYSFQAAYDLANADGGDGAIRARAKILTEYPIRDMIKRGWVDNEHPDDLENDLCRFFNTNSLESIDELKHSPKKTGEEPPTGKQLAWLFRVKKIAAAINVPAFSNAKLSAAIDEMAALRANPEEIRHVAKLLNDAGVRFVIVEGLPGGKIDGVCFWLSANEPVIGMSLRFDRIDNFWFVLRHECAHVLHGHGKDADIIDSELESSVEGVNDEEDIANLEAAEFCINQQKMKSFYARKRPLFSDRDIRAFSQINGVHPGIVVGQLHRLTNEYRYHRKHLSKVRQFATASAFTDGWGETIPIG